MGTGSKIFDSIKPKPAPVKQQMFGGNKSTGLTKAVLNKTRKVNK